MLNYGLPFKSRENSTNRFSPYCYVLYIYEKTVLGKLKTFIHFFCAIALPVFISYLTVVRAWRVCCAALRVYLLLLAYSLGIELKK